MKLKYIKKQTLEHAYIFINFIILKNKLLKTMLFGNGHRCRWQGDVTITSAHGAWHIKGLKLSVIYKT